MQNGAYETGQKLELERNEQTAYTVNDVSRAEPRICSEVLQRKPDIQSSRPPAVPIEISRARQTKRSAQDASHQRPLIVSSKKFTADFVPPDYLIDGLAQRRFIYSLTGNTGAGKTAIALRLAAHVALGVAMGEYDVEQGRVLYFAGENPDDLRMRWLALSEQMGFSKEAIDVHFVVGAEIDISEAKGLIEQEVRALGGVCLVIVDTSAAYFNCEDCDDENNNVQARRHAAMFRSLTTLPDGPTVIVLAHPAKNAKNENLVPRGGGAFLNEVDGNFTARKDDNSTELHWQGKFRGPEFDPMSFELHTVSAKELVDSKGRPIRTVVAVPLSDEDRAALEASQHQDGDLILSVMGKTPGLSLMEMAKALDWKNAKQQPDKRRTQKSMDRLKRGGLVIMDTNSRRYALTKKGKEKAALASEEGPSIPNTVPTIQ
jgi:hypothetical protein